MMKSIFMIPAAAALIFCTSLSFVLEVYAANQTAQVQQQKDDGQNQERQQGPRRRPQLTMEEMQLVLSSKYRVSPTDTKRLIDSGVKFQDLQQAALYSYMSEKSVDEVLALKKHEVWTRVQYLLGITPAKYGEKNLQLRAENMQRWWGLPVSLSLLYMKQGYPMHWVKIAWILAKHSDWTVDQILKDRKFTESWKDWCKRNLGIAPETYDQWISEYQNPTYLPGKYF